MRREASSGGKTVIKRVMPRQNEKVNEIWICDKGRFGYHYTSSTERLTKPLLRKNGELQPAEWDEVLDVVAHKLIEIGSGLVSLAGGKLSNESLYNLYQLVQRQGGKALLNSYMGGGDLVSRFGFARASNLSDLKKGDVVLVAASDLHEEAPIWWLRLKQAAERGAEIILVHPRQTRMDKYASLILRHDYGQAGQVLQEILDTLDGQKSAPQFEEAARILKAAENLLVFYGSEGLSLGGI